MLPRIYTCCAVIECKSSLIFPQVKMKEKTEKIWEEEIEQNFLGNRNKNEMKAYFCMQSSKNSGRWSQHLFLPKI